jgi:anaerobic selenocysteine-containing dehydrogenase
MYHSWGSMNAWLRQIHTRAPLYVPGPVCAALGLADGDWAWVISAHGRIKVEVARSDAVNPDTLWTWNAIGKRGGAWALAPDVPEARRGFLLNHLIGELLPPKADGRRWSNSDPITGQAAWYDLRVRLEKAEPGELSEPHFKAVAAPPGQAGRPAVLRYGEEWST